MIDKIGHIKNPLTVIAMFAGLAEVSGTAVLPFVEEEAQLFYVKFLSLFPCLIVGLFFYTLWKYPRNLYAPSDYSNENNFVSALGFLIAKKTEQEIEEASIQLGASAPMADAVIEESSSSGPLGEATSVPAITERGIESRKFGVESETAIELPVEIRDRTESLRHHSQLLSRLSQSTVWVLRELSLENNLTFVANVSPSGQPDIVFDAVGSGNGFTILVEIKYASTPKFNTSVFTQSMKDARAYYDTLPEEKRKNFGMVLAIVTGEDVGFEDIEKLKKRLRIRISNERVGFSTQVRVFSYQELSQTHSTN